jgi:hypothetical protein
MHFGGPFLMHERTTDQNNPRVSWFQTIPYSQEQLILNLLMPEAIRHSASLIQSIGLVTRRLETLQQT